MKSRMMTGLGSGLALSLAAVAALPAQGRAQQADNSDQGASDEGASDEGADRDVILVQGTKDAVASIVDYPGSVAVFDGAALEARQFTDLSSLSYAAPNVSLDPIGTFKGVANFAIRGLGINSSIPSIDPAVGLFIDGVYAGINAGTVLDEIDIEQVEILRGPQGVAFGRNTTGGAVLVRTADPSEDWEGHARLSVEAPVDEGRGAPRMSARTTISGPLADGLSFRIGALHSVDGGYFRNLHDGDDFGEERTDALRGALAFRGAGYEVVVKGGWTGSNGDGAAGHNNGLFERDRFAMAVDQRGFYRSDMGFVTARAAVDVGPGRLTSIFGWRDYDLRTRNDIDSSPTKIFESDTRTSQHQWSNELTYAVEAGPLRLVTGAYAFSQVVGYDETRDLSAFNLPTYYGGGVQHHDVYGLFGQVDMDVTDALSLKAGLRWSREEKSAAVTYVRPRAACSAIEGSCPTAGERVADENNGFTDARSWEGFSPRVVASYALPGNAQIYASWARGIRSGGYNLRVTQSAAFEQVAAMLGSPAFDRERVDTVELGAKWQSADAMLFLEGAVFRTSVDGLQREVNVPSTTSGLAQSVYNTADARITGGEAQATLNPLPGLSLSANLGLIDAEYREIFFDLTGDGAIDGDDLALRLPRAPKWTYGTGASWQAGLGGATTLTANAFWQHRSAYAYTDNNWGYNTASDRIDASLVLDFARSGVTVAIYGRNLLDELQFGGDTQLSFAGGPLSDGTNLPFDAYPAAGTFSPMLRGRTLGMELAVDF